MNDNSPRFYTSLFQESVSENVPIGYSIVRVSIRLLSATEFDKLNFAIIIIISRWNLKVKHTRATTKLCSTQKALKVLKNFVLRHFNLSSISG